MEKLDIRSSIVSAEEVFLSLQSAKQTILQGLEVQTDRKLQGCLVKAEELIKQLHLLDMQANPGDYGKPQQEAPSEEDDAQPDSQGACQTTESV